MLSRLARLLIVLAVVFGIRPSTGFSAECPGSWIHPTPVTHRAFDDIDYQRFAWPGQHLVLLTPSADLCGATVRELLDKWDRAYDFYVAATGREPTYWPTTVLDGRTTVTVVPDGTCGAACAYVGWKGIELSQSTFDETYHQLLDNGLVGGIVFYELGFNFWFYGDRLEYIDEPGRWANVTASYPSFMSALIPGVFGYPGSPFYQTPFDDFLAERLGLVDQYVADQTLNWENSLRRPGDLPFGGGGNVELLASMLHRLERVHGTDWVLRLWREAGARPTRGSTQDAVDNMVLASSVAAGVNLVGVFADLWRWPVSDTARADAANRFGLPVDTAQYVGTCGNHRIEGSEACDGGECCARDCRIVEPSTPCSPDGSACSADVCNANGVCEHRFQVDPSCRLPAAPSSAILKIDKGTARRPDRLRFVWTHRPFLEPATFGAADAPAQFELCLYADAASPAALAHRTWAEPLCGNQSCWRRSNTRWIYERRAPVDDGLLRLELASRRRRDRTRVEAIASGPALNLPVPLNAPISVEIRGAAGQCFGARFTKPLRNTNQIYVAASD